MGNPSKFVLFSEVDELLDYNMQFEDAIRKVANDYGTDECTVRDAWHEYCED